MVTQHDHDEASLEEEEATAAVSSRRQIKCPVCDAKIDVYGNNVSDDDDDNDDDDDWMGIMLKVPCPCSNIALAVCRSCNKFLCHLCHVSHRGHQVNMLIGI